MRKESRKEVFLSSELASIWMASPTHWWIKGLWLPCWRVTTLREPDFWFLLYKPKSDYMYPFPIVFEQILIWTKPNQSGNSKYYLISVDLTRIRNRFFCFEWVLVLSNCSEIESLISCRSLIIVCMGWTAEKTHVLMWKTPDNSATSVVFSSSIPLFSHRFQKKKRRGWCRCSKLKKDYKLFNDNHRKIARKPVKI